MSDSQPADRQINHASVREAPFDPGLAELRAFAALTPTQKFQLLVDALEWMRLLRSARPTNAHGVPGDSSD